MEESLVIRPATAADAPAVAALLTDFNGEPTDAAAAARRMAAMEGTETVLLALRGGAAVGLCSLRVVPFLSADHPYAEVTELYVAPQHRRQGIARRLMAEAEALARAKGAPAVYLLTGFRNETAQAFYRSIGYGDYALAMWRRLV